MIKILDTSFIVDLLLGDETALKKANEIDETSEAATTAINAFEIFNIIKRSMYIPSQRQSKIYNTAKKLLNRIEIFPYDKKAAEITVNILNNMNKRNNHNLNRYTMILAIAISNGCNEIITKDKESFFETPLVKIEEY